MFLFGAKNVRYGITLFYACAGSDEYFHKLAYFAVALSPIVLWGAVILILSLLVPSPWFWCVYGVRNF